MENRLIKSKYFTYAKAYIQGNEHDLLSNIYQIDKYDIQKEEIIAHYIFAYDDDKEIFSSNIINDNSFKFIDESIVEKELIKRKEQEEIKLKETWKKICEEHNLQEKVKNNHFSTINPPIKRHTKIKLIGKYNKSSIDFSKEDDHFYIDDVQIIDNKTIYFLRVVAYKKNRGIYVFRPKDGFEIQNLQIINETNDQMDYDYIVDNDILKTKKRI